jgi:hypothetical protein
MSIDRTGPSHGGVNTGQTTDSIADTEGSLFAATPVWERRGKKRGRPQIMGGSDSPSGTHEPRSFGANPMDAPLASSTAVGAGPDPMDAPLVSAPGSTATAEIAAGDVRPHHLHDHDERLHDGDHVMSDRVAASGADDHPPMAAPIGRERTTTARAVKKSGPPAAAIALGVLALGGLGVAGMYAMQDDEGVPELTPGVESTGPVAAVAPPMTEGAAVASRSAAPAMAEPARAAPLAPAAADTERRATRMASATRTRPAAPARSASEAGVAASGTAALPSSPQPYSSTSPDAPAATPPASQATAPTTVNPAPVTPESPAAPSESTPPTAPAETPAQTTSEPPPQA